MRDMGTEYETSRGPDVGDDGAAVAGAAVAGAASPRNEAVRERTERARRVQRMRVNFLVQVGCLSSRWDGPTLPDSLECVIPYLVLRNLLPSLEERRPLGRVRLVTISR